LDLRPLDLLASRHALTPTRRRKLGYSSAAATRDPDGDAHSPIVAVLQE
jgi:hypothetical protein